MDVEPAKRWVLIARAVTGAIGYCSLTYSVGNLPLFIWTLIINTAPFWTAILGYYILGEKVSRFDIGCLIVCFTGVLTLSAASEEAPSSVLKVQYPLFGMACALLNALCYSNVIVMTRKVKEIHYSLVLLSYGLIATSLYTTWVLVEFVVDPESKALPRIFYYNY